MICSVIPYALKAQAKKDTAYYKSKEVRVEAERITRDAASSVRQTAQLNREEIKLLNTVQSSELMKFLPSVFVRDYGGLGGLKTISLRGATAAQTTVYLDGIRLNTSQNGLFDFSTLPSSFVETLQVHNGIDPSFSSTSAIGGVVTIETSREKIHSLAIEGTAGVASFKTWNVQANAAIPCSENMQLHCGFDVVSSRGNYSFFFNNFGKEQQFERANADYNTANASLLFRADAANVLTTTQVLMRSSRRGAPGSVVQGNINNSTARLYDDDMLIMEKATINTSVRSYAEASIFGKYNEQRYIDPEGSTLGFAIYDVYFSRDCGATIKYHLLARNQDVLHCTAECYYSDIRGNLLRFGASEMAERLNTALGLSYMASDIVTLDNASLSLTGGIRFDSFSDLSPFYSPRVGAIISIGKSIGITFSYQHSFRPPSFNELYFQNYGTTTLTPERAHTFKAGFEYKISNIEFLKECSFSTDVFNLNVRDQIIAVPRSAVTWSAQNIALVHSSGIELGMKGTFLNTIQVRLGYTFQDVRDARENYFSSGKIAPYSPQHLGFASIMYSTDNLLLGATFQYTGLRYTQSDNADESALPAFVISSLFVSYEFKYWDVAVVPRVECSNLFNEQYSVVANYPMPGRMLRFTLSARL